MDHDPGVQTTGRQQAGAMQVISPHTEDLIAVVDAAGPGDVDAAVAAARAAAEPWGRSE
ncbi:MAG: aldehyde dehydrogenase family protein, partial [Mycobacterium sp.]